MRRPCFGRCVSVREANWSTLRYTCPMMTLDYQTPRQRPRLSDKAPVITTVAVLLPVLCSICIAGFVLRELWSVPAGMPVRPMALFLAFFIAGIVASLVCLIVSGTAIALAFGYRRRRWIILAILALLLSLVPVVSGDWAVAWLERYHGLVLDD